MSIKLSGVPTRIGECTRAIVLAVVAACALSACDDKIEEGAKTPAATVLLGGDLHFAESYERTKSGRWKAGPRTMEGRYRDSFDGLLPLIASADLTIANLEGPLAPMQEGNPLAATRQYLHWSRPRETGDAIRNAGVDVVNLSNNHTMDQGEAGLTLTLDQLGRDGTSHFGAGINLDAARRPFLYTIERGGGPSTVLAVFPGFADSTPSADGFDPLAARDRAGLAPVDPEYLREEVARLRQQNPNIFVIAYPHWGRNYSWVYKDQVDLGRRLIDAGADMVLGHHAHTIQEIEKYKGRWIVYGLGNFNFLAPGRYRQFTKVQPYSFVAQLRFEGEAGAPPRLRLFPLLSDNRQTGFKPHLVNLADARRVISAVQAREGSNGLSGVFGETELGAYFEPR